MGFKVAFVAQDGIENMQNEIPYNEFDVCFIGGSTPFKYCRNKDTLMFDSNIIDVWESMKDRHIPIHMGRVNSEKRMNINSSLGGSSSDGTLLKHGDRINLPRLIGWLDRYNSPMRSSIRNKQGVLCL